MKKLALILTILFCTACASATIGPDTKDARVFGKAHAEVVCVTDAESGDTTCTVKSTGEGLTENAVGVISKFFESLVTLPGAAVRTVGGALP